VIEATSLTIHRAKWIVPVEGPPVENGAVAVFGDRIAKVGTASEVCRNMLGKVIDHGEVILCPGLVNSHVHLELSPLKWRLSPTGSFVTWVRSLVGARNEISPEEWVEPIEQAVQELKKNGTAVIGDVGNQEIVPIMANEIAEWPLGGYFFHELLCPKKEDASRIAKDIEINIGREGPITLNTLKVSTDSDTRDEQGITFIYGLSAHSCYTVAPELLKTIKAWNSNFSIPFSLHVAESPEEIEFFSSRKGPLRELLEERGHWPLGYEIPKGSPFNYLDSLGLMDESMLCVHCVQVTDEDINIIKRHGASVCLCPRSNIFLGVGTPPADKFLRAGINVCLGTDSLASNDQLSIFAEMSSLASIFPEIPAESIFRAATIGGARAMGLHRHFGTLSPGKSPHFLSVRGETTTLDNLDLYEYLVNLNPRKDREIYWVDEIKAQ